MKAARGREHVSVCLLALCSLATLLAQDVTKAQRYSVSTLSGAVSKLAGYSGDGGPATRAQLRRPEGVAIAPGGALYIADTWNHAIRLVYKAGIITTVAGTGESGYNGDGVQATTAQLSYLHGISVDSQGNLYIAEGGNHRIRRVNRKGVIETIAGNGDAGYTGNNGPATEARIGQPAGLAFDRNGVLFFTDWDNDALRKVTADGIIHMVAGFPWEQTLKQPGGLAFDAAGRLYVADRQHQHVCRIEANGSVTVVAGDGVDRGTLGSGDGGPALVANIPHPNAVAFDGAGNLLIATIGIRQVDLNGIVTRPFAPGSDLGLPLELRDAAYNFPQGLVFDVEGTL